jgi:hypothetical protein
VIVNGLIGHRERSEATLDLVLVYFDFVLSPGRTF